jgi:NAD(P)-dependent dehydrogenase (short-subunit alcohol dehydrogenase family)
MGNSVPSFSTDQVPSLAGKTILVTGANTGIGFAAARVFVEKGAKVIVAGRDSIKVAAAVAQLGDSATGEIVDLASLASIDEFVAKVRREHTVIDVLVDNAGVFIPPHCKTVDGFEVTLGTNVIGTAHLTNGLLSLVAASPTGRIVVLSSAMAQQCSESNLETVLADVGGKNLSSTNLTTYGQSKALNAMWAEALQSKLQAADSTKHIIVSSLHPGFVDSDIQNKTSSGILSSIVYVFAKIAAINVNEGALSTVFCATAAQAAEHPGKMWGPGPKVALFPLSAHLTGSNSTRAFDVIDAAIKETGRSGFVL